MEIMETWEFPIFVNQEGEEIGEEEISSMISVNGSAGSEIDVNLLPSQTIPLSSVAISVSSSSSPSSLTAATSSPVDPLGIIFEATQFATDIQRLNGELGLARRKIMDQDAEIIAQNVELGKTKDLLADQKKLVGQERKQRLEAERKLANLKNSVKSLNEEYSQVFEDVRPLIEGEQQSASFPKETLDQLSKFVGDRLEKHVEEQMSLKATVSGMNQVFQNLMETINSQNLVPSTAPGPVVKNIRTPKTQPELQVLLTRLNVSSKSVSISGEKDASGPPQVSVPLSSPFQTNLGETGMPVNTPSGGLRFKDVVGSLTPLPIPIDLDDDKDMLAMQKSVLHRRSENSNASTPVGMPNEGQGSAEVFSKPVFNPGKKHSMDIAKRHQGIYCICGIGFESRTSLDAHIQFQIKFARGLLDEEDKEKEDTKDLSLAGMHEHDTSRNSKFFYCSCRAKFATNNALRAHIRQKTEKWNFGCEFCKKVYFYQSTLKLHMLSSHKISDIGSKTHGEGGVEEGSSTRRVKRQMSLCAKCGKKFKTPKDLLRHNVLFHEQAARSRRMRKKVIAIGCLECGLKFGTFADLRQHEKVEHSKDAGTSDSIIQQSCTTPPSAPPIRPKRRQSPRLTPIKGQQFHGWDTKKRQLGLLYCICGVNCKTKRKLEFHIYYHNKERNFHCSMCPSRFPFQSILARHLESSHKIKRGNMEEATSSTHRVKRQRRCRKCGKGFKTQGDLLRHHKLFHKTTIVGQAARQRIKKRRIISRNFSRDPPQVSSASPTIRARKLTRTPTTTTTERQTAHGYDTEKQQLGLFYCICGRKCKNRQSLQVHISYHTKERHFCCTVCESRFPFLSYLTAHLEHVHNIDPSAQQEFLNVD